MIRPSAASPRARVLVVEDEPMIGRILEHKLRREGHDVTWHRRGREALDTADAQRFDVALVDISLDLDPDLDGIDLAARLVHRGAVAQEGWLALVARRDADGANRALSAGAAGLVIKPFKPTEVAARVATLLAAPAGGAGVEAGP